MSSILRCKLYKIIFGRGLHVSIPLIIQAYKLTRTFMLVALTKTKVNEYLPASIPCTENILRLGLEMVPPLYRPVSVSSMIWLSVEGTGGNKSFDKLNSF